jgi:ATP-dependent protease Clp ATPase subunit
MSSSLKCSFCGSSAKDGGKLIKAPKKDVYICDGCVEISMIIILQAKHPVENTKE